MAHWEPLAGHPAPHHLEETTMTSTCILPSSPDYYSGETSTLQPEVSQNRPADVDAAQAAFEAALMAINTRTSTPYVAGTFAFNV